MDSGITAACGQSIIQDSVTGQAHQMQPLPVQAVAVSASGISDRPQEGASAVDKDTPVLSRNIRISTAIAQKRKDVAVLFRPEVKQEVINPLLRSIDFLGIHHVMASKAFGATFNHAPPALPGRAYKWLDFRFYEPEQEQKLVMDLQKQGFTVVSLNSPLPESTDDHGHHEFCLHKLNMSPDASPGMERLADDWLPDSGSPLLLIVNQENSADNIVTSQLLYLNTNALLGRMTASTRCEVKSAELDGIFSRLTSLSEQAASKLPEERRKLPSRSFDKLAKKSGCGRPLADYWISKLHHCHPQTKSTRKTVFVLDNIELTSNMFNILLLTCSRGMKEMHFISSSEENCSSMKHLIDKLGCPVSVSFHNSAADCLEGLKRSNYTVFGTLLDKDAVQLEQPIQKPAVAIILGNEYHGISKEAAAHSDIKVMIPQRGLSQYVSASAAAAILVERLQSSGTDIQD